MCCRISYRTTAIPFVKQKLQTNTVCKTLVVCGRHLMPRGRVASVSDLWLQIYPNHKMSSKYRAIHWDATDFIINNA